jgi:hypothetical protein
MKLACILALLCVAAVSAEDASHRARIVAAARLLQVPAAPCAAGSAPNCQPNIVPSAAAAPAAQFESRVQMFNAAPLQTPQPPNPANYPVLTPAAGAGGFASPITGPLAPTPIGQFPVETVPGVRIVGKDGPGGKQVPKRVAGWPWRERCRSGPLADAGWAAWLQVPTIVDKIEQQLDLVKTKIVAKAKRVQRQNVWVKQVERIIAHYQKKVCDERAARGASLC